MCGTGLAGCEGAGARCTTHAGHRRDQSLCAALERLADELPDLPASEQLSGVFKELIEASLRWDAATPLSPDDPSHRYLDALQAEDVREALFDYWAAPDPRKVGQLSYMLRALFDGRRRAVQIEQLTLGCADCAYSDAN